VIFSVPRALFDFGFEIHLFDVAAFDENEIDLTEFLTLIRDRFVILLIVFLIFLKFMFFMLPRAKNMKFSFIFVTLIIGAGFVILLIVL
jgi:hypothetical protein